MSTRQAPRTGDGKWPKPGTSGTIKSVEGLDLRYTDIPVSGELLRDDPYCPDWVQAGTVYWIRHSVAGAMILGPVLHVEDGTP